MPAGRRPLRASLLSERRKTRFPDECSRKQGGDGTFSRFDSDACALALRCRRARSTRFRVRGRPPRRGGWAGGGVGHRCLRRCCRGGGNRPTGDDDHDRCRAPEGQDRGASARQGPLDREARDARWTPTAGEDHDRGQDGVRAPEHPFCQPAGSAQGCTGSAASRRCSQTTLETRGSGRQAELDRPNRARSRDDSSATFPGAPSFRIRSGRPPGRGAPSLAFRGSAARSS
jgi:hypothetical protein